MKRITVELPPEVHAELERRSQATGSSVKHTASLMVWLGLQQTKDLFQEQQERKDNEHSSN